MRLAPGTPSPTKNDPRTVEQSRTLRGLDTNADGSISSKYRALLLTPNGLLTKNYVILTKPPTRINEINAVLAAGTDPAKPSGGYILVLDINGVPIQYIGVSPAKETVSAPIISAQTPTAPTPSSQTSIKLSDLIRLSISEMTRSYTKGTLKAIDNQTITTTNTSTDISIQVSFGVQPGIVIEPQTFLLAPNGTRDSVLTFDLATIDKLSEGSTTYNIPISLTSPVASLPTTVVSPPSVTPTPVATPTPPPVVTPPAASLPVFGGGGGGSVEGSAGGVSDDRNNNQAQREDAEF